MEYGKLAYPRFGNEPRTSYFTVGTYPSTLKMPAFDLAIFTVVLIFE